MFAHALGSTQPLAVAAGPRGEDREPIALPRQPFAVVGRAGQCDVALDDQTVSLRHLYLQTIRDRVFAIDLFSANGCKLGGERFASGWLEPNQPLQLGRRELSADATAGGALVSPEPPSPLKFKPRRQESEFYGPLPRVELELVSTRRDAATWPINRIVTLLGRSDRCRITCSDESISSVHCMLVLTTAGLWVVDTVTRTGTYVNGEQVRCALLAEGHELRIGKYTLRASYDRSEMPQRPEPEPAPVAGLSPGVQTVAFKTKNHKVFKTETAAPVLIVRPQGDFQQFRPQEVQLEGNALIAALGQADFPHAVIDFSDVEVVRSVMLEAIASICRAAKGKAAFCCATPRMYASLEELNLHTLWYHYNSRGDAVAAVTFPG